MATCMCVCVCVPAGAWDNMRVRLDSNDSVQRDDTGTGLCSRKSGDVRCSALLVVVSIRIGGLARAVLTGGYRSCLPMNKTVCLTL